MDVSKHRGKVRIAKSQAELDLAKDIKINNISSLTRRIKREPEKKTWVCYTVRMELRLKETD